MFWTREWPMFYKPLLLPLLIQVFLTFAVWVRMYYLRLTEIRSEQINPQDLATRAGKQGLLARSSASSDNLMNQFEMPVLFYAAVLLALTLMWQDPMLVGFCWAFVAARAAHALIHTTYNNVVHRFSAYVVSSAFLAAIWVRLGWYILSV
jgi:hypothetical protein